MDFVNDELLFAKAKNENGALKNINDHKALRDKIFQDTCDYLDSGGTITQLPAFQSSEGNIFNPNRHRRAV